MASINVFVKGHKHLEEKYYQRSLKLKDNAKHSLSEIGKMLKTYVQKEIRKQVGTPATRYNPTRTVTVSKPGKFPNNDRGRLIKGIRSFVKRGARGKVNLMFQSTAPYALDLEFGARANNMEARPYMRPTLNKNRKKINAILAKGVRRAL